MNPEQLESVKVMADNYAKLTQKPTQDIQRSDSLGKLSLALSKAQKLIKGAKKDATNPFFKASYADLSSVWDACHDALNDNELCVIQMPEDRDGRICVTTLLTHSSGEWISSRIGLIPKSGDPQVIGSLTTYLRRYALAAMTGVCPIDDDAEIASVKPKPVTPSK